MSRAAYLDHVLRINGARLAVPLTTIPSIILSFLLVGPARPAEAAGECRRTSTGIVCVASGSSAGGSRSTTVNRPSSSSSASRPVKTTVLPPLRYVATSGGRCWYWSRYPPGYDSWNPRYDQRIIDTRFRLPQCTGASTAAPLVVVTVDVPGTAWSVFRSFPLDAPSFWVTPAIGITNLPSRLHLGAPRQFAHTETLPDGRNLDVVARVEEVRIEWADGSGVESRAVAETVGDPGEARHTYLLKTCPEDYRVRHLDGPKCHSTLEYYPVTVTFVWTARYRTGGAWTELGSIDRSSSIAYDVDEVLGVLTHS